MNIFLVHGFWDTGKVFRRLQRELTAAGHVCFAPTLHPRDGRHGLDDLARKLAVQIDAALKPDEPLAIVGFSMGCLVSRFYIQHLRGDRSIKAFFAISGPLRGTAMAYFYPSKGARDMRFRSQFLRGLDASANRLEGLALHTYFTPYVLMIIPSTSSRLNGAVEVRIKAWLHPLMLTNHQLSNDIVSKLRLLKS